MVNGLGLFSGIGKVFKGVAKVAAPVVGGILGGPAGASAGGALAGALGGSGGSGKAVGNASAAQIGALGQGVDMIRSGLTAGTGALNPWLETGNDAVAAIAELLGLNGAGQQQSAIAGLKDSPLFRSLFSTGEEAILQNASATGGLRGGNINASLAEFGSDTLAQVIQQQLANLGGLSTLGLDAGRSVAGLNADASANIAKIFGAQGDATASALLAQQGIKNQSSNNLISGLTQFAGSDVGSGLLKSIGSAIGKIF
jgi:hypothetical protein